MSKKPDQCGLLRHSPVLVSTNDDDAIIVGGSAIDPDNLIVQSAFATRHNRRLQTILLWAQECENSRMEMLSCKDLGAYFFVTCVNAHEDRWATNLITEELTSVSLLNSHCWLCLPV